MKRLTRRGSRARRYQRLEPYVIEVLARAEKDLEASLVRDRLDISEVLKPNSTSIHSILRRTRDVWSNGNKGWYLANKPRDGYRRRFCPNCGKPGNRTDCCTWAIELEARQPADLLIDNFVDPTDPLVPFFPEEEDPEEAIMIPFSEVMATFVDEVAHEPEWEGRCAVNREAGWRYYTWFSRLEASSSWSHLAPMFRACMSCGQAPTIGYSRICLDCLTKIK